MKIGRTVYEYEEVPPGSIAPPKTREALDRLTGGSKKSRKGSGDEDQEQTREDVGEDHRGKQQPRSSAPAQSISAQDVARESQIISGTGAAETAGQETGTDRANPIKP